MVKVCTRCGAERDKPKVSRCRDCRIELGRIYYAENKEVLLKRMRERDPEGRWEYNIKRWYGLTASDYYSLLEQQNGCCAICKTEEVAMRRVKKFHIDHCHATGKVRGLLCAACNHLIGCCKDDVSILGRAAAYLES